MRYALWILTSSPALKVIMMGAARAVNATGDGPDARLKATFRSFSCTARQPTGRGMVL